jgi:glutaredoxin
MAATDHAVTLITRVGCHLCEQAETTLRALAAELGFRYAEVDVDADPALKAEHSDDVPVIMLDGRQHGFWRVEEKRLRRDLAR